MRALAHPVRLAILDLLHERGNANATECAREVGESPQACSYHLRELGKWGFIRRVASDDGRETRWETAARAVNFSSRADDSRELQAAASLLKRQVLDRDDRIVATYLAREHELDEDWHDAATFSTGFVHVTADELRDLTSQITELLKPYGKTRPDAAPDARRVDVIFRALPKIGS